VRVVSLLPAATEIVACLGATEHLGGVTHECDYPDIVSSRARVTRSAIPSSDSPAAIDKAVHDLSGEGHTLFSLDHARIRSLHPDLLLTQALCDVCAVRETDVRALAATLSPEPRVVTLGGTSLDGVYADIEAVAAALDTADEAEELLAGLHERVATVHKVLKNASAPRPRVALVEWTDPVYIAGHWGPEQIRRAGGIDVIGEAGTHSTTVDHSRLRDSEPEIVLFAPCGYSLERSVREGRALLSRSEWSWLSGRQVWALDANALVSRPGPRLVDGIEVMARIFNPGLFSPVDARHAARLS
jgi:iron complex transport system substrate-binding protein